MTAWCVCGLHKCADDTDLCPCCADDGAVVRGRSADAIDRARRADDAAMAQARIGRAL